MRHSTIGSMIGKRSMISWFRLFVFWVVFRFFLVRIEGLKILSR